MNQTILDLLEGHGFRQDLRHTVQDCLVRYSRLGDPGWIWRRMHAILVQAVAQHAARELTPDQYVLRLLQDEE